MWRKVLAAGLVLRGAELWLYRAGLGLSGGQRGIVERKAVDGMWEYSRPGQRWLCDGRLGGVGGGCVLSSGEGCTRETGRRWELRGAWGCLGGLNGLARDGKLPGAWEVLR